MSRLLLIGALVAFLASGCTSCGQDRERDAGPGDSGADGDAAADADHDAEADGEPDADNDDGGQPDAEVDADAETDAETDTDELPPPVPMELVEIPHDRPGLDCGPGCRQVTFAEEIYEYDISERYLSYQGAHTWNMYLVNLFTMTEYQVDMSTEEYLCMPAAIDSELMAYATTPWAGDQTTLTLWRYEVGDSARYPIVNRTMTARARTMDWFDVSGDTVAWRDSAIDPAGLYAMNLYEGDVINLTHRRCLCYGDPLLEGRQVVYDGWQAGSRDIWLVNVDTLEEENIVDHPAAQFDSAFDGEWVVWTDGRNDPSYDPYGERVNPDIYGMSLETREVEPLCDHPATQLFPDVRDGLVVWRDWRNAEDPNDAWTMGSNTDIYLLDLETRREVQVTSLPGTEQGASVWGRRVFFVTRDLTGQGAVFMVDLEEAGLLEPEGGGD